MAKVMLETENMKLAEKELAKILPDLCSLQKDAQNIGDLKGE